MSRVLRSNTKVGYSELEDEGELIIMNESDTLGAASTAEALASTTAAATDANLTSGNAERPLDQLTDDELDEAVAREEQRVALLEKKLARSRRQNRLLELRKRGDLLDDELTASEAENPVVKFPDVRSRKQAIATSSSAKPRGWRSDVSLPQLRLDGGLMDAANAKLTSLNVFESSASSTSDS